MEEVGKRKEGRRATEIVLPRGQQSRPLGPGGWGKGSCGLYSKMTEDSIYLTCHTWLHVLAGKDLNQAINPNV